MAGTKSVRSHPDATRKSKRSAARHGARKPKRPFPAQYQPKLGLESMLEPRPRYEAPNYAGSGKLDGRVALITAGDSGIGRSVSVLYAREGADVAIVYLPEEESDAVETRDAVLAEGTRCLLVPGDVRDSSFCRRAVQRVVDEFGQLDILVNNAAFQQHRDSIEGVSDEQLERTVRTNSFGYFYMARAAIPHMKRGSAIVNTGSITGPHRSKGLLDYASTKGAIRVFFASNADSSYITGEVLTLLCGETTAA